MDPSYVEREGDFISEKETKNLSYMTLYLTRSMSLSYKNEWSWKSSICPALSECSIMNPSHVEWVDCKG